MVVKYSVEEIFQIGIDIEKNGENFYRAAAEAEADPELKRLFIELQDWEAGHVKFFSNLKKNLANGHGVNVQHDTEDEYYKYLKALADSHVFVVNDDVVRLIARCSTPIDVLKLALKFEKDSVVLYTAMKNLAAGPLTAENVDFLIQEELKHVALLSNKIASLSVSEI